MAKQLTKEEFKQIAEKFGFTTFSIAPWDKTIGIYVDNDNARHKLIALCQTNGECKVYHPKMVQKRNTEGVMKYFIQMDDRYNYYKKPKNLENRLQSIVDYIHKLKAEIKRRQIQNICKEKF